MVLRKAKSDFTTVVYLKDVSIHPGFYLSCIVLVYAGIFFSHKKIIPIRCCFFYLLEIKKASAYRGLVGERAAVLTFEIIRENKKLNVANKIFHSEGFVIKLIL